MKQLTNESTKLYIPPKHPALGHSGDSMTFYNEADPAFTLQGSRTTDPYTRCARMLKQLWALDDARKIMKRNGLRPGGPQ